MGPAIVTYDFCIKTKTNKQKKPYQFQLLVMSLQFAKWSGTVIEPINTGLDCCGSARINFFSQHVEEWGQPMSCRNGLEMKWNLSWSGRKGQTAYWKHRRMEVKAEILTLLSSLSCMLTSLVAEFHLRYIWIRQTLEQLTCVHPLVISPSFFSLLLTFHY